MSTIIPIVGFAEPFSAISHLIGAGIFGCLALFLIRRGIPKTSRISLGIFAGTCISLLLLSTVYHSLSPGNLASAIFQRLDHAAIFAFIAGTFTPIHSVLFSGFLRWGMLSIVWTIAAVGIALKTAFFELMSHEISLCVYVLLGWLGLVAGIALWRRHNFRFVGPLLWGVMAYTLGALIEAFLQSELLPGIVGPHEIFHLAVLAGIGFHWFFIRKTCIKLPIEQGK